MEKIDPVVAARVWQRVQRRIPQEEIPVHNPVNLQEMLRLNLFSQGLYRTIPGGGKFWQEKQRQTACIRGLLALENGSTPIEGRQKKRPARGMWADCYHLERRLLGLYEAGCADNRWGQICHQLLPRQQKLCQELLPHLEATLSKKRH